MNTNRFKRIAKWAVIIGAIVCTLDISIILVFTFIRPTAPHFDAVIVLGAKVGTPALTQRALQGLKYYDQGKTDTIVLSGSQGAGESMSEAEAMKQVIDRQVAKTKRPMPKLILESKSVNTFQNIHNSKALIPNAKSVLLVSDCFHLARSVIIAKRDGFPSVYWDAPAPSYYQPWDLVFYYLREVIGILVYIPKFITN